MHRQAQDRLVVVPHQLLKGAESRSRTSKLSSMSLDYAQRERQN